MTDVISEYWCAQRHKAENALASSELLIDRDTVAQHLDALAERIADCYHGEALHVLAVMTGALFTCAELLRRIRQPLTLDYLHATRYRDTTRGGDIIWKVAPPGDLLGRHVLIVDDILDEGHTLRAIRDAIAAQSPASLRIAVLADKQHDRRAQGIHADFIGFQLPDRYVFGCGMDAHGFWRQLPEIRALESQ